ncbi:nucleotidyltransferase domain-containing protein [Halobacillus sp. H74]|uniref:nucleotidyltransferase domain-containing protein n=1 Tax=Halobacillus sp. H74 TaxID=3457436 RepID=UPI003FCE0116
MESNMGQAPIKAATQIIHRHHRGCDAALLAGSVVRGEATSTSDLDLVLFYSDISASYRESFQANSWPVECFVHSWTSYKEFFKLDCERGQPSMPRMVAEGVVIKNHDKLVSIKEEADLLLEKGPLRWSKETIEQKRYFLTDTLDDFIGCSDRGESIFIANTLAQLSSDFHLRVHGQWSGSSKWMMRALRSFDPPFAARLMDSFTLFYEKGKKEKVIDLVDDLLRPYGGRFFDGFSIGKQ